MNRALLAIALVLGTASAGCLIDRGPLLAVDADRPPDDAFIAEVDAEGELPDAWIAPVDDAAIDAALDPDAWVDPIDAWSQPDTGPDAPTCTPRCADPMTLVTCAGDVASSESCPLGCNAAGPRCFAVNPSNVPTSLFDETGSDLTVSADQMINTDLITLTRTQRDGSVVAVMVHGRVEITGMLRIIGSRPLVILARDGVSVSGTIDVSAVGATPGPRGIAGATIPGTDAASPGNGRGGAHSGDWDDGGGGGGALCGNGGTGGTGGSARGGGGGGAIDFATDGESLRGGGGGGAGHGSTGFAGLGGAGGGALQISSRGAISVTGRILARGSAGGNGSGDGIGGGNDGAAGGGGAGGWILLEAPTIDVRGSLDASGAAGGRGDDGGGPGSAGAGASSSGGNGGSDTSGAGNGGGGGGGAGCIVIRSIDLPVLMSTSPSDAVGLHRLPLLLE